MKNLSSGTAHVPASGILTTCSIKLIAALNSILPADCQIKTSRDGYIVATIFFVVVTLLFYPAVVGIVYCAIKAGLHREGGYR